MYVEQVVLLRKPPDVWQLREEFVFTVAEISEVLSAVPSLVLPVSRSMNVDTDPTRTSPLFRISAVFTGQETYSQPMLPHPLEETPLSLLKVSTPRWTFGFTPSAQ
ncbi:hypothetical protein COU76_03070 [Candidatus Peregrinibacteria bacterium CG10_big_fil_rev_8_21_14_0_10_49_10]|nr:MAG: hypothetical protein COU76_03070 [Candidatus Peregrinibacteria bacterium CG10_big_fil_rev_8_21_14_0_10_49_10]